MEEKATQDIMPEKKTIQDLFYETQDRPGTRYSRVIPGDEAHLRALLRHAERGVEAREVVKELRFLGGMNQGSQFRYLRAIYGVNATDFKDYLPAMIDYLDPTEASDVALLQRYQLLVGAGNSIRRVDQDYARITENRRTFLRPTRDRRHISEGVEFPLVLIPLASFPEEKKEYPKSPAFLSTRNIQNFNLQDYRTLTPRNLFDSLERKKIQKTYSTKTRIEEIKELPKRKAGRPSYESINRRAWGLDTQVVQKEVEYVAQEFKEVVSHVDMGLAGLLGFLHQCFTVSTDKVSEAKITNYSVNDLLSLNFDAKLLSAIYSKHRARVKAGSAFSAENSITASDWQYMLSSNPELFYEYMMRYSIILHRMADCAGSRAPDAFWVSVSKTDKQIKRKYRIYCWNIFRNNFRHLSQLKTEHYCLFSMFHPYHVDAGTLGFEPEARFYFTEAELRYLCTAVELTGSQKLGVEKVRVVENKRIITKEKEIVSTPKRGYFNPRALPEYLQHTTSTHWARGYLESLRAKYNNNMAPVDATTVDSRFTVKTVNTQEIFDKFCAEREWKVGTINTFKGWLESDISNKNDPGEKNIFGSIDLRRFVSLTYEEQRLLGDRFMEFMKGIRR